MQGDEWALWQGRGRARTCQARASAACCQCATVRASTSRCFCRSRVRSRHAPSAAARRRLSQKAAALCMMRPLWRCQAAACRQPLRAAPRLALHQWPTAACSLAARSCRHATWLRQAAQAAAVRTLSRRTTAAASSAFFERRSAVKVAQAAQAARRLLACHWATARLRRQLRSCQAACRSCQLLHRDSSVSKPGVGRSQFEARHSTSASREEGRQVHTQAASPEGPDQVTALPAPHRHPGLGSSLLALCHPVPPALPGCPQPEPHHRPHSLLQQLQLLQPALHMLPPPAEGGTQPAAAPGSEGHLQPGLPAAAPGKPAAPAGQRPGCCLVCQAASHQAHDAAQPAPLLHNALQADSQGVERV